MGPQGTVVFPLYSLGVDFWLLSSFSCQTSKFYAKWKPKKENQRQKHRKFIQRDSSTLRMQMRPTYSIQQRAALTWNQLALKMKKEAIQQVAVCCI